MQYLKRQNRNEIYAVDTPSALSHLERFGGNGQQEECYFNQTPQILSVFKFINYDPISISLWPSRAGPGRQGTYSVAW